MVRPILFAATLLVAHTSAHAASGLLEQTQSPYFEVQGDSTQMPLRSTRAQIAIAGVIAHVRVTQVYVNEGTEPIEAVYVFPGSTRAAVFGMEMKIGERTIVAEIAEKDQAKKRYEKAKRAGKSASLLAQERPNVFRMQVANIMPSDRIEVRLDYSELLVPENGVYQVVYPSVVGPRFTAEDKEGNGWNENPHLQHRSPSQWSLSARITAGTPISAVRSPSHTIAPRFTDTTASIEVLDQDGGNRDFVLRYKLAGDQVDTGLLRYESDEENFFLLTVQPPERVRAEHLVPREYLFIIDVSGSMSGFPLDTAETLVTDLLERLRPEDTFNLLAFAGGSSVFAERSVPATPKNIARGLSFLNFMNGGGGTQILKALNKALAMPRDEDRSTTMLVITDGYVSVEKEVFTKIREQLGNANLFAFGIGSSVNRHLIEGMARAGLGEPFIVLQPSEAIQTSKRFLRYVSSPVLTNIRVTFDGFDAYDVEPNIPDLFAERPLVIMGKYRKGKGRIVVTGEGAEGRFIKEVWIEGEASDDLMALRQLWARDRIARLSDFALVGAAEKETITALGLKYSLMTQYTSFVAVDTIVRGDGPPKTIRQALPLPRGMDPNSGGINNALGGLRGAMGGAGGYGSSLGIGGRVAQKSIGVRMGAARVTGSLDKSIILRVIRQHIKQIRYCYERELQRNPNLAGKLVVQFVIGADGWVKSVKIKSSTLNNERVETCILHKMKSWRFPKPAGGGKVVISYPFVFRPAS